MSAPRFAGRVAVVTGAASGIGRAVASLLADEGAAIVAADVDRAGLSSLSPDADGGPELVVTDVASAAEVRRLASVVARRHGRADVLVNCAGVHELGTAESIDEGQWERLIAINLTGTFLICRSIIPLLTVPWRGDRQPGLGGRHRELPRQRGLQRVQGRVVTLTKNLAIDCAARGIRVNCVCPYSIDGPMMDRHFARQPDPAAARAAAERATPMARLGRAEEVARAVPFSPPRRRATSLASRCPSTAAT